MASAPAKQPMLALNANLTELPRSTRDHISFSDGEPRFWKDVSQHAEVLPAVPGDLFRNHFTTLQRPPRWRFSQIWSSEISRSHDLDVRRVIAHCLIGCKSVRDGMRLPLLIPLEPIPW